MKKIKVLTVFGTRPEAIKMVPIIKELEKYPQQIQSIVTVTGQHRQMLDQTLSSFDIFPNYDLDIMREGQTLVDITTKTLTSLTPILQIEQPMIVLVHGDTTTAFAAALAAFYQKIPVGHVEAGLRTWDKYSPFPEELNRQLVDNLADIYFAPTEISRQNLLLENHPAEKIFVTGNTAIDMMNYTISANYEHPALDKVKVGKRTVLLTMHRRENLGLPMAQVFKAIHQITEDHADVEIIFPVHKNPAVRKIANLHLETNPQVQLIEPLDVNDFHNFAANAHLILTDSGGVQEEAPSLGVPVLVLRDTTERPEGIAAGTLRLIGTEEQHVYQAIDELLTSQATYDGMAKACNPYGDGRASQKIVKALLDNYA